MHAGRFAQLATDALDDLPQPIAEAAATADLAIADVPSPLAEPAAAPSPASLATFATAKPGQRPQLTLFRRPIELRAADRLDLVDVIRSAAVDAIADALGNPPGSAAHGR